MEKFFSIDKNTEVEITVKKSKFIANLIKVDNQEMANEKLKEIKKKYHDARHNCFAYRVYEDDNLIERFSDDGEPSGTAGSPMLNILQKNDIANVLVVVTRYFGGILLGTGGLIRAYSDATLNAISDINFVEYVLGLELQVDLEYDQFESFKYYCKKNGINIEKIDYTEKIVCLINMEENKKDKLMTDYSTKNINLNEIKILSKKFIEKSIIK